MTLIKQKSDGGEGGSNAAYNCLDRHVEQGFGDKVALIWEGNDPFNKKIFIQRAS